VNSNFHVMGENNNGYGIYNKVDDDNPDDVTYSINLFSSRVKSKIEISSSLAISGAV
jgi:hypothetical protein